MALVTAPAVLPVRGASPRQSVSTRPQAVRVQVRTQPAPVRLTTRGRRVVAILALIPIVFALVVLGSHKASADSKTATTHSIKVQPGQSLWDVAVAVAPKADPRATIWTIEQLNHMSSSTIFDGQALVVPVS